MRAYMTTAEFQTLAGVATTADMLKRASLSVENVLTGVVYQANDQGVPADADVLLAVQWAIVYQVQSLERFDARIAAATARVNALGLGGKITSAKIGTASYTMSDPDLIWTDLDADPGNVCLRSLMTLRSAGLQTAAAAYG